MDMKQQRHLAIARMEPDGRTHINVIDNGSLGVMSITSEVVPEFLKERIALLKLCDIDRESDQLIGRRFSEDVVYVYLSFDEHREIINLTGVQP